jgi:hypothetical protein
VARSPAEGAHPSAAPGARPGSAPVTATPAATPVAARLVVPAYFHPAAHPGLWEALARHAALLRLVILNVASGPGDAPDAAFARAVALLHRAGVTVAGYVGTGYGRRRWRDAIADMDRYLDWYGVASVCLDQAAAGGEHLGYYARLAEASRARGGAAVLFNHGVHPDPRYAAHADLLGTFEGPWHAYRRLVVPRWVTAWPAGTFCHVVHSVPPGQFRAACLLTIRHGAGSAYITDACGANPYRRLPTGGLEPATPGAAREEGGQHVT